MCIELIKFLIFLTPVEFGLWQFARRIWTNVSSPETLHHLYLREHKLESQQCFLGIFLYFYYHYCFFLLTSLVSSCKINAAEISPCIIAHILRVEELVSYTLNY